MVLDVILDALLDTAKLIPFLFLTYLVMEYLEHKTKNKSKQIMRKSGHFGPLIGGIVGAFPQCGFSAAHLYLRIRGCKHNPAYSGTEDRTGSCLGICH